MLGAGSVNVSRPKAERCPVTINSWPSSSPTSGRAIKPAARKRNAFAGRDQRFGDAVREGDRVVACLEEDADEVEGAAHGVARPENPHGRLMMDKRAEARQKAQVPTHGSLEVRKARGSEHAAMLCRRERRFLLEQTTEVGRVLVSDLRPDLGDGR